MDDIESSKSASNLSVIEEVRKLHEAYQFISIEHQKRLDTKEKKRRSSVAICSESIKKFQNLTKKESPKASEI